MSFPVVLRWENPDATSPVVSIFSFDFTNYNPKLERIFQNKLIEVPKPLSRRQEGEGRENAPIIRDLKWITQQIDLSATLTEKPGFNPVTYIDLFQKLSGRRAAGKMILEMGTLEPVRVYIASFKWGITAGHGLKFDVKFQFKPADENPLLEGGE